MKKEDYENYRKKLIELKEKIEGVFENLTRDHLKEQMRDSSGDLSGYSLHMADAGTDNFDREFAINIAGRENEILQAIDRTIEKIDNQTYGICEMCGQEITTKRLDAIPYAERCFTCESEIEKEQS
ncbi:MAG: TraR/DksA C4-type zinc finger protein [Candidatus Aureabacteria bacterium]|nr:TraR/DksA C4-type zinc finger protein [Candidatus Auribacterota bacterium]